MAYGTREKRIWLMAYGREEIRTWHMGREDESANSVWHLAYCPEGEIEKEQREVLQKHKADRQTYSFPCSVSEPMGHMRISVLLYAISAF